MQQHISLMQMSTATEDATNSSNVATEVFQYFALRKYDDIYIVAELAPLLQGLVYIETMAIEQTPRHDDGAFFV